MFIIPRITNIGNNAEDIGLKLFIEGHCLLVRAGQQDFRPGPHGEQPVFLIKTVRNDSLSLPDQFLIQYRQQGGEIKRGIFYKENYPNIGACYIIEDIELILNTFDYCQQNVRLSGPEKDMVNI